MPQWIFIVLFGIVQAVIVGLVVALRAADHEKFATLEERITGSEERLVKSIDELRQWKHEKIDPYVPPVIDEHERRIDRLEVRVFNGDSKGRT